jgi:hypothetical protein
MARRRSSYAWSLLFRDRFQFESYAALEGFEYAQELAQDARRRRADALVKPLPSALTVRDLAEREGIAESTVRNRIRQARLELWGTLSDSGIYYRLRRGPLGARDCEWCGNPLPAARTTRRRYCIGSRCRVAASRARRVSEGRSGVE